MKPFCLLTLCFSATIVLVETLAAASNERRPRAPDRERICLRSPDEKRAQIGKMTYLAPVERKWGELFGGATILTLQQQFLLFFGA